jgi:hypothetical protein
VRKTRNEGGNNKPIIKSNQIKANKQTSKQQQQQQRQQ